MHFTSKIPTTKHQKGRAWATATLVICGAFSIWANVRSGQLAAENVVVSVFPPIVAFLTSHLISYFSPKNNLQKILVWGGMGLIMVAAMIGSGTHITETVMRTGQSMKIGLVYVFFTDAPMLLAGIILVIKVPTTQTVAKPVTPREKPQSTQPAKKAATPAKRAPAKTTVKTDATV